MLLAKVTQLEGAFSTKFEERHTHYVEAPVRPGLQACVIELQQLDGRVKLIDALTVLPNAAPTCSLVDPIYAAFLSLIDKEYRSDIATLTAKCMGLARKKADEPPFRCAVQCALRLNIFAAIENENSTRGPFPLPLSAQVKEQFSNLVESATSQTLWHPKHKIIGRTRKNWRKAWAILARWDEWELGKLSWHDRVEQHYADIREPLLPDAVKKKDAFRKMCASLNLKKGDLSLFKRGEHQLPNRVIVL